MYLLSEEVKLLDQTSHAGCTIFKIRIIFLNYITYNLHKIIDIYYIKFNENNKFHVRTSNRNHSLGSSPSLVDTSRKRLLVYIKIVDRR